MVVSRVWVLILGALTLSVTPASAQVVTGRVVDDSTRLGVPGVTVTAVRGGDRIAAVATDSAGRFRLRLADSATYRLRADRIGYASSESNELSLGGSGTTDVELRVRAQGIPLEPLVVISNTAPEAGRVGFARRRDLGRGVFLTADSLRLRHMAHPVDALKGVPEITVSRGAWFAPRVKNWAGSQCLTYYVDHYTDQFVVGRGGFNGKSRLLPLSLIDPADIVAVEVYPDSRDIPAELDITGSNDSRRSLSHQAGQCGVVHIWTKHAW